MKRVMKRLMLIINEDHDDGDADDEGDGDDEGSNEEGDDDD